VHFARLEQWGGGLATSFGEMVAAHLGMVLAVEASVSRNSDAAHGSSVPAFGMGDADPASAGNPCYGL
jgi:hypothetical protein